MARECLIQGSETCAMEPHLILINTSIFISKMEVSAKKPMAWSSLYDSKCKNLKINFSAVSLNFS